MVGLMLLTVAAALILAQRTLAGTGGGPLTATGAAAPTTPIRASVYVVRAGDTLWSIAHRLDPSGDERPLVYRLAGELNGASLYPGQVIQLPAGA